MHAMHIITPRLCTDATPAPAPPAPMHTYILSPPKDSTMSNETNRRTSLRVNTDTRNALMSLRYRWGCPSTDACILRLIELYEESVYV